MVRTAFRTPARRIAERMAVFAGHRWPYTLPGRGTLGLEISRTHSAPLVAELLCGARMSVPPIPEGVSLYLTGCYPGEESTTRCLSRYLSPGDIFLNLGANLGFYTLLAAIRVGPRGRVHAFEPQPALLTCIARSIELNRLEDVVTLVAGAVTDRDGQTVSLHMAPNQEHTGLASIYPHRWLRQGATIPVRTVTVDAHLANHSGCAPCVVKLDIEGAELSALRGMRKLLSSNRVKLLIVEISPPSAESSHGVRYPRHPSAAAPIEIATYLASFGFTPFAIAASGKVSSALTGTNLSHVVTTTNVAFVRA